MENILEENHFKKNVIISPNQIKEKFLNSIDSQKTVLPFQILMSFQIKEILIKKIKLNLLLKSLKNLKKIY